MTAAEEYDKNESEEKCTCLENSCKEVICKGNCGCKKHHNDYMDFLSDE